MKSLKISQGSHILSRYIYSSECRGIMSKRSQASVPEIGSGHQVWHLILPNILLWRYSVKLLLFGSEMSPRNANVFPCVCLSVCLCGTLCSKALWWPRMTPGWLRMTPGWIRMNPNKEQRRTPKKNSKEHYTQLRCADLNKSEGDRFLSQIEMQYITKYRKINETVWNYIVFSSNQQ